MKLKDTFIVHKTETETVLVPVGGAGFSGIVRGNATLGDILGLLETDTDVSAMVSAMAAMYDAPEDVLRRDVEKTLAELRDIGALDE